MTINVGSLDRIIRFGLGIVLIVMPFVTTFGIWENPIGQFGAPIVGLVLITTAFVRFCPIYRIFGMRTCKAA